MKNYIIAGLAIAVCLLISILYIQGRGMDEVKQRGSMYDALSNKHRVLVGSYEELKSLKLRTEDSLTKELQKAVAKNTLSATAFSTRTLDTVKVPTKVIELKPEYIRGKTEYLNPTYFNEYKDSFINMSVISNKDSATIAYQIKDSYLVSQIEKREKTFGTKNTYIKITSKNPRTEISDNSSYYKVKNRKQYKGLWFLVGIIGGSLVVTAIAK